MSARRLRIPLPPRASTTWCSQRTLSQEMTAPSANPPPASHPRQAKAPIVPAKPMMPMSLRMRVSAASTSRSVIARFPRQLADDLHKAGDDPQQQKYDSQERGMEEAVEQ